MSSYSLLLSDQVVKAVDLPACTHYGHDQASSIPVDPAHAQGLEPCKQSFGDFTPPYGACISERLVGIEPTNACFADKSMTILDQSQQTYSTSSAENV